MPRANLCQSAAAVAALLLPARAWADVPPSPTDVGSSGAGWIVAGVVVLAALGVYLYRRRR